MSDILAEHLAYLQLPGRIALYRKAIGAIVKPGDVVADLGCGFGALGMLCLEQGAGEVYGIEHSDAIEIARESVKRAGFADRYHCLRATSYHIDLPAKVDLLICDHVGFLGIDYSIIPLLRDAQQRLLKPGGAMIPRRLRLQSALASSDACRASANGFGAADLADRFGWLDEYSRNSRIPHQFSSEELCSDAAMLDEVDLTAMEPDSYHFEASLTAGRDTQVDGIAAWFEAELAHSVWMTNDPLSRAGIGREQAFLPLEKPFAVRAGDTVKLSLRFRADDPVIAWSVEAPGIAPRQTMSTFKTRLLTTADLAGSNTAPAKLSKEGQARLRVLEMVDGKRSRAEIEQAMLEAEPALFPSEHALRHFVGLVLAQDGAR